MLTAHVHEILEMISMSGKAYSSAELQQAIEAQFGNEMRFNSCSIDNMNAEQAVEFLISRGKFIPQQTGTSCCGSCGG